MDMKTVESKWQQRWEKTKENPAPAKMLKLRCFIRAW